MFSGYVQSLPREPQVPNGPFNRHVHTVFGRAKDAAQQLGSKKVEPEHLALALLSVKSGSCYETLKEFSIDPEYRADADPAGDGVGSGDGAGVVLVRRAP